MDIPFPEPTKLSPRLQRFLFTCAFWVMAADEQLTADEQMWLDKQFGEALAAAYLTECLALDGDAFLQQFEIMAKRLQEDDRAVLLPPLPAWLRACAAADGVQSPEEQDVIRRIEEMLWPRHAPPSPHPPRTDSPPQAEILEGHTAEITSVCATPDGRAALSASRDGTVRLWDPAAKTPVRTFQGLGRSVFSLAVAADGSAFTAGNEAGTLACCDLDAGELHWRTSLPQRSRIPGLAASPDGAWVAACTLNGTVEVRAAKDGQPVKTLSPPEHAALRTVAFSPDGQLIAAAGDAKEITLWDTRTWRTTLELKGHENVVTGICFDGEGRHICSVSRDDSVRLWSQADGAEVRRFDGHAFSVYGVAAHPRTPRIASAAWDHTLRLWDANTGALLARHERTNGRFSCVAFLAEPSRVVAGCSDNAVLLVNFGV